MKKALFALLLSLGTAFPSFAQSDSLSNEVGFSTQLFFGPIFSSSGAPFEFMFKRQIKADRWARYGLDFGVNSGKNSSEGNRQAEDYSYTSSGFNIAPSIGLEKRLLLSEKWKVIYGADVSGTYSHRKYKSQRSFTSDSLQYNCRSLQKVNSYGAALKPFLGIIFSPLERLYFSTEASAVFGGLIRKGTTKQYQADELQSESKEDQWHLNLDFLAASAIFVYYRF